MSMQSTDAVSVSPAAPAGGQILRGPGKDGMTPGFNEGLFGFMGNPGGFAVSCCCPCIPTANMILELEEGATRKHHLLDCLSAGSNYTSRQAMRKKYEMGFAPWTDCLMGACCGPCSVDQDARELMLRGSITDPRTVYPSEFGN